jgi:hypothetical protein
MLGAPLVVVIRVPLGRIFKDPGVVNLGLGQFLIRKWGQLENGIDFIQIRLPQEHPRDLRTGQIEQGYQFHVVGGRNNGKQQITILSNLLDETDEPRRLDILIEKSARKSERR